MESVKLANGFEMISTSESFFILWLYCHVVPWKVIVENKTEFVSRTVDMHFSKKKKKPLKYFLKNSH